MKQVWVIKTTMAIEFQDGTFTKWDKLPTTLYGFEKYEDSIEELQKLRNLEVEDYKEWFKKQKGCFIHHNYQVDSLMIFKHFTVFDL